MGENEAVQRAQSDCEPSGGFNDGANFQFPDTFRQKFVPS